MKKIKFNLVDEIDYANIPMPAKNYLPKWYKDLKPDNGFLDKEKHGLLQSFIANKTAKKCIPFMESFTSGYILETWTDMEIIEKDNNFEIKWIEMDWKPIQERPQTPGLIVPDGYYQKKVSLQTPFFIKTPPGYSVMVSQPYNRYDLPFLSLTGIVDTDIHPMFPGSSPLFVKKGSSGIVPKGTPLLQIFPFKRDNWKSLKDDSIKKEGIISKRSGLSMVSDWYRQNAWSKKSYE